MDYLVLDLGGSAIKYALIDDQANFIEKGDVPAPTDGMDQFVSEITGLYEKYKERISGVGISMPGAIDPDKGYAYTGGSYTFIKNMNIVEILHKNIPLPITIGNDAKCAANAEVGFGVLQDVHDGAIIVLGTGIGGCIVIDKKVHIGRHFASGEFSWMRTNGEDGTNFNDCWCMKNGISGLLGDIQEALETDQVFNGKEIFAMVNEGNEKAIAGLDKFCKELAIQIFNLQTLFDPEKIAIGGGISAQPVLLEYINKNIDIMHEEALKHHSPIARPNVVVCQHRNDANLLGAYYQLKESLK